MNFGQVITAMVTPFNHNEEIDYSATKSLVNYLIANGTDALVVAGTTGESPTLTKEEKLSLFKYVLQVVDGRIPVIAGTGSNSTRESIALTQQAEMLGVDGVMLVAPYYNKPSQEGLYQHFKAIASATQLPVMLYNVPGRTAVNISVETIIRLSHIQNIVSVKEASGDLDAMGRIISETDNNFSLYSGDDNLTLPVIAIGGIGVVSVASHIIGNEIQEMIQTHQNGFTDYAAKIHSDLMPTFEALFAAPNPTPVKAALEMYGLQMGTVRLPMVPLNLEEKNKLHAVIQWKIAEAVS